MSLPFSKREILELRPRRRMSRSSLTAFSSKDSSASWSPGGVMVTNYVAAFVLHCVGVLHPFLHGHRRRRIGEEANGDIFLAKFAHRRPLRSPRVPSPAPLGSGLLDGAPCRRGCRGASSLVRQNQGVGRPLLSAPQRHLPPRSRHDHQRWRGNVHCSSSTAGLARA